MHYDHNDKESITHEIDQIKESNINNMTKLEKLQQECKKSIDSLTLEIDEQENRRVELTELLDEINKKILEKQKSDQSWSHNQQWSRSQSKQRSNQRQPSRPTRSHEQSWGQEQSFSQPIPYTHQRSQSRNTRPFQHSWVKEHPHPQRWPPTPPPPPPPPPSHQSYPSYPSYPSHSRSERHLSICATLTSTQFNFVNNAIIPEYSIDKTFFESQEGSACGRHVLNNLFGCKIFKGDYEVYSDFDDIKIPISLPGLCQLLIIKEFEIKSKQPNFVVDNFVSQICNDADDISDKNYSDELLEKALELLGYSKPDNIGFSDEYQFNEKFRQYYNKGARWFLLNYIYHDNNKHWVCIRINDDNTFQYIDSQLPQSINQNYKDLNELIKKVNTELKQARRRRDDINKYEPHISKIKHIIIIPYCKNNMVKID